MDTCGQLAQKNRSARGGFQETVSKQDYFIFFFGKNQIDLDIIVIIMPFVINNGNYVMFIHAA